MPVSFAKNAFDVGALQVLTLGNSKLVETITIECKIAAFITVRNRCRTSGVSQFGNTAQHSKNLEGRNVSTKPKTDA